MAKNNVKNKWQAKASATSPTVTDSKKKNNRTYKQELSNHLEEY